MGNSIPVINEAISAKDKRQILQLVKPIFKCSKAKKDIELSICQNLVLRDIDGRMGKIYWELREYFPENVSKQLKSEQLKWLRKRDSICNAYDENCLVGMYKERINELKAKF